MQFFPQKQSKVGLRRTVSRFAFLPVKCHGNVWVWLESYKLVQEVQEIAPGKYRLVTLKRVAGL